MFAYSISVATSALFVVVIALLFVLAVIFVRRPVRHDLFRVELLPEQLKVLLFIDDLNALLVGLGLLPLLHVIVSADYPETLYVAAGDLATIFLLLISSMLLIDAHGASIDILPAIEGRLPGLSVPRSVAADVVDRAQVTDAAWPGVHTALRHVPRVVGRLSFFAVFASELVRVNGEAVARVGARHLPHVAADLHGCPGAILGEPEGAIRVRRGIARVVAHLAVAHTVVGIGPGPSDGTDL